VRRRRFGARGLPIALLSRLNAVVGHVVYTSGCAKRIGEKPARGLTACARLGRRLAIVNQAPLVGGQPGGRFPAERFLVPWIGPLTGSLPFGRQNGGKPHDARPWLETGNRLKRGHLAA
jgi:hypothetical protein